MARKSRVVIEGESGAQNLAAILELVAEESDSRERGAMLRHHAADCSRWIRALKAAALPVPGYVVENAAHLRAMGWSV